MNYYLVMGLTKSLDVDVMGRKVELNLSWASGIIGALPVFETRELAEKYADGKEILAITTAKESKQ